MKRLLALSIAFVPFFGVAVYPAVWIVTFTADMMGRHA